MTSNSTDTGAIRKFGLVALIFFGILCGLGIWRQKPVPIYVFGLLSALGLGFILMPTLLRPVYTLWIRGAHLVGKAVTAILLALAYYLVMTPTAWLKRLFGGRPLPVKPDKKAASYWVTRTEPAQPRERFLKRF